MIVLLAQTNDFMSLFTSIHFNNFTLSMCSTRTILIRQKVMMQPFDEAIGAFMNVLKLLIKRIPLQHGDDFIVSLVVINHSKSADGSCF